MIGRKPNTMFDPEQVYAEIEHVDQENREMRINLVILKTGEIRQKAMSFDEVAKRAFQSEIDTWKGTCQEIPLIPFKETSSSVKT